MSAPKVSVIMSVYNGERYLREAVESILNQTFRDLEFIIIDDGSTDGTADVLRSYNDPRIVLLTNTDNIGLTASLNRGLGAARGKYIARMDADDISLPKRLERQIAYLDTHPEVGLLGTWVEVIDEWGERLFTLQGSTDSLRLKWLLLVGQNLLTHSATMYRRSLVERLGGYHPGRYSQDYELWSRMSFETQIAQLPEILLRWRNHSEGISTQHLEQQWETTAQIMQRTHSRMLQRDVSIDKVGQIWALWAMKADRVDFDAIKQTISALDELLTEFGWQYRIAYSEEKNTPMHLRRLRAEALSQAHVNAAFLTGQVGDRFSTWKHVTRAISHCPSCLANSFLILACVEALLGPTVVNVLKQKLIARRKSIDKDRDSLLNPLTLHNHSS